MSPLPSSRLDPRRPLFSSETAIPLLSGRWMLAGTGIALALLVLLGGGPLERVTRRLMHRPETKPGEL